MVDAYGPIPERRLLVIKIYAGCLAVGLLVMLFVSSFVIVCGLYLLASAGFVVLLAMHHLDPRTKPRQYPDHRI